MGWSSTAPGRCQRTSGLDRGSRCLQKGLRAKKDANQLRPSGWRRGRSSAVTAEGPNENYPPRGAWRLQGAGLQPGHLLSHSWVPRPRTPPRGPDLADWLCRNDPLSSSKARHAPRQPKDKLATQEPASSFRWEPRLSPLPFCCIAPGCDSTSGLGPPGRSPQLRSPGSTGPPTG